MADTEMSTEQKLDTSLDEQIERSRGQQRRSRGGRGGRGPANRGEKRAYEGGPGGVIRVARRIYVSNLSWQTTWQALKDHFAQAGNVVYADVMKEPGVGGRSKGCGIVEFSSAEEAADAINTLHQSELDGREIYVREDREDQDLKDAAGPPGAAPQGGQEHQPPPLNKRRQERLSGGPAPGSEGNSVAVGRKVYVNRLSYETTWQGLKDHFKQAGAVVHADVLLDGENRSKGCGVVEFGNSGDALRAISLLSNSTLDGRQITVREDREDTATKGQAGPRRERVQRPQGDGANQGKQVVVQGLPWSVEWAELKDLAKPFGNVLRAEVPRTAENRSRGYGTVLYETEEAAQACIAELSGTELQGRTLAVKLDRYA